MQNTNSPKMITVWHHPEGMGVDGATDMGPQKSPAQDHRWSQIRIREDQIATVLDYLPLPEAKKVKRAMKKFAKEEDTECKNWRQLIEGTCGQGLDFTLAVEEYDEMDELKNEDGSWVVDELVFSPFFSWLNDL